METQLKEIIKELEVMDVEEQIKMINDIKIKLHEVSPMKNEPVDCVIWVKNDKVKANNYNPNKVAPPEMELLKISIMEDGYTQPIVAYPVNDYIEVVDGFHRNRVGKECNEVEQRVKGFLPIVKIREEKSGKNERIASTIRHNRARGKHLVDSMSQIVIELKNRNWKNSRISRELGMDEEEILRLCQITGLEDIFKDDDFSKSWNIEDSVEDFEPLTDELDTKIIEENNFRTVNTSDPNRIFHTYDKWECHKAGFFDTCKEGMTAEECEFEYARFLSNTDEFKNALENVITKWKHSCEHYLTNKAMNRIAWLGQAALCYAKGIPSKYRSGWSLLSENQQDEANHIAYKYLNKWLKNNNYDEITFDEAMSIGRQVEIY
jgi:ParB-like chromosome segregation protein Spo0J